MKKLLVLFVSFISLTINSQEKAFGQWNFYENEDQYLLINLNGIAVKNCKDVPSLVVEFTREGDANFYLYNSERLFPGYTGDDVKVEVIYRSGNGSFSNGYQDENLKITFNSNSYKANSSSAYITKFSSDVDVQFDIDFFTAGLSDTWDEEKQVYFKTTLNGESKVFRFYLDGYKDAYDYFEEKYDENIDPFE